MIYLFTRSTIFSNTGKALPSAKDMEMLWRSLQKLFADQTEVTGSCFNEQVCRDLKKRFDRRVNDFLEREEQAKPLFHIFSESKSAVERLQEFVALGRWHKRSGTITLLSLFINRMGNLLNRIELLNLPVSGIALVMVI